MNDRPTGNEIDELFARFNRTRRRRDRNLLVEAHIGFAHHVARRYSSRGIPDDDLRQIAFVALVSAVDRFDPEYGAAFTSFAGRTIEGEIKKQFRDTTWAVRVPRSTKEMHLLVRRAHDELSAATGRSPTVREVAGHLDVDPDTVVTALAAGAAFRATSLEDGNDAGSRRTSSLAHEDAGLEAMPDRLLVERLLTGLPPRERRIVELRFFEERTQAQIAEEVGVSQMHVSRLLRRSFTLMRQIADDDG